MKGIKKPAQSKWYVYKKSVYPEILLISTNGIVMKITHIKFPSKNGALLGYIANKRANLAHYIRKIKTILVTAYQLVMHTKI